MNGAKETRKKKSMARKTSSLPTRVYSYGASHLSEADAKLVHDQIFLGNRYRNRLVEIERNRRTAYRELRSTLSPEIELLEKEADAAEIAYQEARKLLSGGKKVDGIWKPNVPRAERDCSPIAKKARKLRAVRNKLGTRLTKMRMSVECKSFMSADKAFAKRKRKLEEKYAAEQGVNPGPHTKAKFTKDLRASMRASERWSHAWKSKIVAQEESERLKREARAASGCFTGVYQAIEVAAMKSSQTSQFMPDFRRFDHTGKVGAQVTEMTTVADAMAGKSSVIKIELRDDVHLRRGKRLAVATLRLSSATLETKLIEIPFVMHREMPGDAIIKWVYLDVDRVGLDTIYSIQFTLESNTFEQNREDAAGVIAINLGWRKLENGDLRVCTAYDGHKDVEIALPASMHSNIEFVRSLLGHADDHFNGAMDILRDWLEKRGRKVVLKEYGQKEYKGLHIASVAQWKGHGRLAQMTMAMRKRYAPDVDIDRLWHTWREERFGQEPKLDLFGAFGDLAEWFRRNGCSNDDQILALYLEWWRRKDAHLITMARHIDRRVRLARRELYRCAARKWADTYKTVVIEKWDKRGTAETPEPEADTRTQQEERGNSARHFAAVSEMTDALKHAFGKAHVHEIEVDNISVEHHLCGGTASDTKSHYMVMCDKCERLFDQDVNAARTMWDRHREQYGDAKNTAGARKARNAKRNRRVDGE